MIIQELQSEIRMVPYNQGKFERAVLPLYIEPMGENITDIELFMTREGLRAMWEWLKEKGMLSTHQNITVTRMPPWKKGDIAGLVKIEAFDHPGQRSAWFDECEKQFTAL